MPGRRRKIRLTHDEILVLFDLVHRWQGGPSPDTVLLAHPGEAAALRRLAEVLAPEVDGVYDARYAEAVDAARAALAP
ncbi:hypothetical protein Q6348_03495 [Isoptericola sp. b441]|uniref:Uncharacterized protein n=1 Tax=Actinotalea lenta TaxID=3064654 RepID=A0ABT9DBD9_9CELL|nr:MULTISPECIES: hypothetical protein [unclassified Isoptericola]MDO8106257.1 hypothetical protein [Isoptericola sp. b441]MDO8122023.1 hypothetical protein [Isoptericola sp. b490]